MDKETRKPPVKPGVLPGAGRLHDASGEEKPQRDISHIDRQEGDMNNGELCGNFSEDPSREEQHEDHQ